MRRNWRDLYCFDMFAGAGGSGLGIEMAGLPVKWAANHWAYALELSAANMPKTDHLLADLLDESSKLYKAANRLPAAPILWASPSCTNHSQAKAQKAYLKQQTLFGEPDHEYDAKATEGERSRSTMLCVLQYVQRHKPLAVVVENVVAVTFWGVNADGSTFNWWMAEFRKLGYRLQPLFINSAFFGAPQYRDRIYIVATRLDVTAPDLEFRPKGKCDRHGEVELLQAWKPRAKSWPMERWGKWGAQYVYHCPHCTGSQRKAIRPYARGAWEIIDWTDLGVQIGRRKEAGLRPLKETTVSRIKRGLERFHEFPVIVVPTCRGNDPKKQASGAVDPLSTCTARQESGVATDLTALVGESMTVGGNDYEREGSTCRSRPLDGPLPTLPTSLNEAFYSAAIFTNRGGTESHGPAARVTSAEDPVKALTGAHFNAALVSLAGRNRGEVADVSLPFRAILTREDRAIMFAPGTTSLSAALLQVGGNRFTSREPRSLELPSRTQLAENHQAIMVVPGILKHNGNNPGDTAPHSVVEPLGTATGVNTASLITAWQAHYRRETGPANGVGDSLPGLVTEPQLSFASHVTAWQASSRKESHEGFGMDQSWPAQTATQQAAFAAWQHSHVNDAPAAGVEQPTGTQVTHHAHGLCLSQEIDIEEVYFRMLHPEELKLAQAFPEWFRLFGPVRNQVKAIGNAVTSTVAQMIIERLFPVLVGR
jgi:DNA (cytosine-5)-methyltransferase 1